MSTPKGSVSLRVLFFFLPLVSSDPPVINLGPPTFGFLSFGCFLLIVATPFIGAISSSELSESLKFWPIAVIFGAPVIPGIGIPPGGMFLPNNEITSLPPKGPAVGYKIFLNSFLGAPVLPLLLLTVVGVACLYSCSNWKSAVIGGGIV